MIIPFTSVNTGGHFLPRKKRNLSKRAAFTLAEVMVATAVSVMTFGVVMYAIIRTLELSKWQSVYETACSYSEQALEYSMFMPYANFANTAPTASRPEYVSNGVLYTTATSTNLIATTRNGAAYTLTNVTFLATQIQLPLDDLGSYVVQRTVYVADRTAIEPAATNVNYKLITVSNTWQFRGRTMAPIVYQVLRDQP